MEARKSIRKFLHVVTGVVDTYKAFPYFATPDHVFETYIGELARCYKLSHIDSRQAESITNAMRELIDFLSQSIPSTATEKSKFMDELNDEYHKLIHAMEAEFPRAKAG